MARFRPRSRLLARRQLGRHPISLLLQINDLESRPSRGGFFLPCGAAPFGRAHTARRAPREGEVGPKGGGAGALDASREVMMPPWLMRSLRALCGGLPTPPPEWRGRARLGAVPCRPEVSVARARGGPRQAKPSEVNGCMICATVAGHRRGIGKGTIAVLLVRSTCFGAFRRPSVVLAATGIAPSRSRAPRLTSRVGPAGGGWLGQIARHSSTHSPPPARDGERRPGGPHGV